MKKQYLSQHISSFYICLMFILFPLVMDNKLFNIVETKRSWFIGITSLLAMLCIIATMSPTRKIRFKPTLSDYFMLGFVIINTISYILTPYKGIAIYGIEGRAFGLFTILFIGIAYFLITRFCELNKQVFTYIMVGSSFISILGILNFFGIDPLGVYTDMSAYHINSYIATLGNINIYSSFFSLTLPLGITMYIKSEDRKNQIFFFVTSLISFIGLIAGNSDSGYLTIGVTFAIIPLISDHVKCVSKLCFWTICAIILSRIMGIIYVAVGCTRFTDSLTNILMMTNYPLLAVIIIIDILMFTILLIKKGKTSLSTTKKVLAVSYVAAFVAAIVAMIIATNQNYTGTFSSLLVWCDTWGINRGFIWKRGFILFTEHFTPLQVLFGCGPDSVKPYLDYYFGNEMGQGIFEYYDNVHNEFLQYLLTVGVTGFISYIGLIVCTVRKHLKHTFNNVGYVAVFTAMVCYLFQSIVNINQAVTTPLFFVIVALLNIDTNETNTEDVASDNN